jgi:PAS domain S-box-containing protein
MRDRLVALFDGVETGLFVIDPVSHRIVDANPVALSLVGAPREEIAGAVCHQFVCPAEAGRCPVTDLGQTVDNSERLLLTVSGENRSIIKTVRSVEIGGRPYLLESFLDITDRKRAEQSLAEQTAYLNTLVAVNPLGIAVLDPEGRIRLSNAALEELFQYSHQEMQCAPLHKLLVPEEMALESQRYMQACRAGQRVHFSTRRHRRDGTVLDVEVYAVPLAIPGKPLEVLALYQDISVRRQIEEEMEERHRLSALAAEIGAALTGADDLEEGLRSSAEIFIRHMHVACARIWTTSETNGALQLQAATGTLAHLGADDARLREAFAIGRTAASGEPQFINLEDHESCLGDPDWAAREQLVAFAACPLKVGERVLGVVAVFARRSLTDSARQVFASVAHNIAQFVERKHGEKSLRESEDRFRTAFEDAPYGMCMVGLDGHFLHANAALCQMLGYAHEELLQGGWQQITHRDDLERSLETQIRLSQSGSRTVELEKRYIRKDGHVLWGCVKILAIRGSSGCLSHYITQVEDITLRKLAEDRLRASEEQYRELFENATEIIFTTDLEGLFTSINVAAEKAFGYSKQEAGKLTIWSLVPAGDWKTLQEGRASLLAGDSQITSEVNVSAKNGRHLRLEIRPRLIFEGGSPVGIQAIARDITGRDIAEMELRQAQKLGAVGRLAAGIAHEINTPLQFVGDNLRFLQDSFQGIQKLLTGLHAFCEASGAEFAAELQKIEERLDTAYLAHEVPEALGQTQEGIERVVTIVRAMKEFAHPDNREQTRADLNRALQNTLTVARNELKYVAEVETEFSELPMVVCSVSDLNQVFLNLLINAAHAISDIFQQTGQKGKIRVRTELRDKTVIITVADNGAGIPDSIRERIFDPFFTTKEVGRGTGQGLAIARAVIERHKGSLTFQSKVGSGTTFFLSIPVGN